MIKTTSIKKISYLMNYFDTFIIDLWGVIHDGKKSFPHALNCLEKIHQNKKNIILISNSSKKNINIISNLKKLGFNTNIFNKVLTSGQTVLNELKMPTQSWSRDLGKKYYHITVKNKNNLLKGLNKKEVKKISEANFIIASSIDPNIPVIEYTSLLQEALKLNLPLVCANPDYESVETNANLKKQICAGSVLKLYESIGGKTFFLGKPSSFIYKEATKNIVNFKKSRTVAIGDSLSHDIYGAHNFGIKSVLITSGIHNNFFKSKDSIKVLENQISQMSEVIIFPDFICKKLYF